MAMAVAMVAAPFLAYVYSAVAGLVVMAVSLLTTAVLARGLTDAVPAAVRRWLGVAVAVNVALAIACLVAVGWLMLGG